MSVGAILLDGGCLVALVAASATLATTALLAIAVFARCSNLGAGVLGNGINLGGVRLVCRVLG